MHFSKWGANLPATMERPQFMHSKISLATGGWVCPKISTTYLLLVSPLLLESATLARACADNLNSSSSSSKFRSSPNLATRWHSDATSTIIESNKSSKKWDETWNHNSTKWIAAKQKKKHLHSRQQIITQKVIPENERTYYHRLLRTWESSNQDSVCWIEFESNHVCELFLQILHNLQRMTFRIKNQDQIQH